MPPAATIWTAQQTRAIELFGVPVAVAASAGTGKTAVLAQRVVRLVADPASGLSLDRLVVVTFTRDAAAQMRRRIATGLAQRLTQDAAGRHAARQLILLDAAPVGTIHALCRRLVREHYRHLGIDPQADVLSARAARRLRVAVANELFEAAFADSSPFGQSFRDWVTRYGRDLDDDNLIATVIEFEGFLNSLPDPEAWLSAARHRLATEEHPNTPLADESALRAILVRDLQRLADMATRLSDWATTAPGLTTGETPAALVEYARQLATGMIALARAAQTAPLDEALALLAAHEPPRAPLRQSARPNNSDSGLGEAQARLTDWRDRWQRLRHRFGGFRTRQLASDLAHAVRPARVLIDLAERFVAALAARKAASNSLDFADLERFTLRLLRAADGKPTALAQHLTTHWQAILVDEYQDTSPIQEAILTRLARPPGSPDGPANLFVVGDIKQSIYGFRQADPTLLAQRLADTATRRVDLTTNFRATPAVLMAVNALMSRLMTPQFGGVDYAATDRLTPGLPTPPNGSADPPALEWHIIDLPGAVETADPTDVSDAPPPTSWPTPGLQPNRDDLSLDTPNETLTSAAAEREAAWLAQRIADLMADPAATVPDADGTPRRLQYRDIAILLRSLTGAAQAFAEALRQRGIPVVAPAVGPQIPLEFRDLAALLRTLDNPRADQALIAAARSPLLGLTDADLAAARLAAPDEDLYTGLERLAASPAANRGGAPRASSQPLQRPSSPAGDHRPTPHPTPTHPTLFDLGQTLPDRGEPALPQATTQHRVALALQRLEDWRRAATRLAPADLIAHIIQETAYALHLCALPQPARRRALVADVIERLRRPPNATPHPLTGLYAQVSLTDLADDLDDSDSDPDAGDPHATPTETSSDDAVRILTIHRAKGLEFPVVFVADLARRFVRRDSEGDTLWDAQLGLGLTVVPGQLPHRVRIPTLRHMLIADRRRAAALSEELRVLYVALTRARHRLILSAALRADTHQPRWQRLRGWDGPLPVDVVAQARHMADWVFTAAAAIGPHEGLPPPRVHTVPVLAGPAQSAPCASGPREAHMPSTAPVHTHRRDASLNRLMWTYPHSDLAAQPAAAHLDPLGPTGTAGLGPHLRIAPRCVPASQTASVGDAAWALARHRAITALLAEIDLAGPLDAQSLRRQWQTLAQRKPAVSLLGEALQLPFDALAHMLINSALGGQLRRQAHRLQRAVRFAFTAPAERVGSQLCDQAGPTPPETVLITHTVDAILEAPTGGLWLLDYQTRHPTGEPFPQAGHPLTRVAPAVAAALGRPVVTRTLAFVLTGHTQDLP